MEASSSSPSFTNKSSKIFGSRSAAGITVCGWWRCSYSFCCYYYLVSSNFTFSAASDTVPTARTNPSPPPHPLYYLTALTPTPTPTGGGEVTSSNATPSRTIIIIIIIIVLSISALFLMALFKFLRFKIRRTSKRVEDVVDQESGVVLPLPKITHLPDRPDLLSTTTKNKTNPQYQPKRFSWEEIETLTKNFSSVIGEGGFSTVYLAYFSDSSLGAVKIHRNSERLNRLFKQELQILLQVRHHNIVNLLGYCDERDEGALVFDYIPNGSLHEKLHCGNENENGGGDLVVLPWKNRMSIAFQLAVAIDYLHENCVLQIVHGDIKTSNVLLDQNLTCKLCDFGFAKMGFSSMVMPSSMLMGSPGYMDPHYLRSGIASKKNDVYSFGVIVLELLMGMEAFCSEKEQLLTTIAGPILRDRNKVLDMVDPRLKGDFNVEEVVTMASLSAQCLQRQPSLRPSMSDVVRTMRAFVDLAPPDPVKKDHHHHHVL